jgi:predicted DNA-binding protein with PD1-like motif
MTYSEGRLGRVFVLRLDDGDVIPGCIEYFAADKRVSVAQVVLLGAVQSGEVVAGPRDARSVPASPMLLPVDGVHEVLGVGLLAPNEMGEPRLHIHGALGRAGATLTGCLRPSVSTWCMIEAVVTEILDSNVRRVPDGASGVSVLRLED